MSVILLEVRHIYDRYPELCGIFTSEEKAAEGKDLYLKQKQESGMDASDFTFTRRTVELDELY